MRNAKVGSLFVCHTRKSPAFHSSGNQRVNYSYDISPVFSPTNLRKRSYLQGEQMIEEELMRSLQG
jgi:hypothetical protein